MNIPSQFFADGELIEVTPKTRELIDCWSGLSEEQRDAALFLLKNMNQKKSKKDAGCYAPFPELIDRKKCGKMEWKQKNKRRLNHV